MKDFFTFYKDIRGMEFPFQAFSFVHVVFLIVSFVLIYQLYHTYVRASQRSQREFQVGMAIYFLVEEAIYTLWLFMVCRENVWLEILPLELCSFCVYVNVLTVYLKKDYLRFFSGVVGLMAGMVALCYPANISGLYPTLSYRTINFYVLHASFVLFSLIQLRDTELLNYRYVKKNFFMMACMYTLAFCVNVMYHTQYMFVGVPPQISVIASLYQMTGIMFFLPVVLLVLFLLHYVALFLLRKIFLSARRTEVINYRSIR